MEPDEDVAQMNQFLSSPSFFHNHPLSSSIAIPSSTPRHAITAIAGSTTLSCARNHPGEEISFRLFLSIHQRQREDQERHHPRRNALLPQAQFMNDLTKRWPHSDCIWLSLHPSIIRRTKAPSVSSSSIHGGVQQLGEWYKSGRGGSLGCIRNGEARDGRPSFWVLVMEF
jgi:hypothetical protein